MHTQQELKIKITKEMKKKRKTRSQCHDVNNVWQYFTDIFNNQCPIRPNKIILNIILRIGYLLTKIFQSKFE